MIASALSGASILGLSWLTYSNTRKTIAREATDARQSERVGKTLGYFGLSTLITGGLTYYFSKKESLREVNPWLLIGGLLGFGVATGLTSYKRRFWLKNSFYFGFIATTSLTLAPMVHIMSSNVTFQAIIATGSVSSSMALIAYTNRSNDKFMKLQMPLAVGLGALLGISLSQLFYPESEALSDLSMYGGLGIFSLFMLYDTWKVARHAKEKEEFDPINESLDIYLDALNLFVKFSKFFDKKEKKN